MEKEAFEPTGLIPRSIIRTVDRFVQQLLPGKEKIALQEYRVSRYQILVSIKSLLTLVLIPLFLNSTIKALVFTPIIEHFWNSHQSEIFLNQYQEKRAFSEMHDFSEKMFFESLLIEPGQRSIVFLPDEDQSETLYNNRGGTSISWLGVPSTEGVQDTCLFEDQNLSCKKEQILWASYNRDYRDTNEEFDALTNFGGYATRPYKSSICKGHIFGWSKWLCHQEQDLPFNVSNLKDKSLVNRSKQSFAQKGRCYKSTPYPPEGEVRAGGYAVRAVRAQRARSALQKICEDVDLSGAGVTNFGGMFEAKLRTNYPYKSPIWKEPRFVRTNGAANKPLSTFVDFDNDRYQKAFQIKSFELAKSYNKQSIVAITNLLGDFLTFFIVSLLFRIMRPELIILKSFLTESVYSLSDTTKSFLLILGMDLLVGFHSPRGWELALEGFLRHIGLPENENFILLFVALFPVFLDTVFKYWIFRYLNKISPSTVVTYHSMIE